MVGRRVDYGNVSAVDKLMAMSLFPFQYHQLCSGGFTISFSDGLSSDLRPRPDYPANHLTRSIAISASADFYRYAAMNTAHHGEVDIKTHSPMEY